MSCIPKILELKGTKEFLPIPSLNQQDKYTTTVIEGGGNYKGYDYLITFRDMGFRCGYVALEPNHPATGENAWMERTLIEHNIWHENLCNCLAMLLINLLENDYIKNDIK